MDQFSRKYLLLLLALPVMIISCKTEEKEKEFTVTGTVKNSKAGHILLEEVNPVTLYLDRVDTSAINPEGAFTLKTKFVADKLYTLRLNNNTVPFATLINDAATITVHADFNLKENIYTVEGSELSPIIQEISVAYPKSWSNLLSFRRVYDSLQKAKAADSMVKKVYNLGDSTFTNYKNGIYNYLNTSTSPAFSWYLLRHFQHVFTVEEFSEELGKAEKKFPGNVMLKAARDRLNQQIADAIEKQKKENDKSNQAKPPNP